MSFMRWQADRGVLDPLDATPPGSLWWRAVNERLLRDGCEAVARSGGLLGEPSSPTIELWMAFIDRPTARSWYRAHNASIVAAYLENRDLAEVESMPERFFVNVVLVRVLYAHALVAAPRLALGRLAPLGRVLGDPRLGMAGAFLSLGRVLPDRYPLARDLEAYLAAEHSLGRMLDYGVIAPRAQRLYDWSAQELEHPGLRELIRNGSPTYAWPYAQRHTSGTRRGYRCLPVRSKSLPPPVKLSTSERFWAQSKRTRQASRSTTAASMHVVEIQIKPADSQAAGRWLSRSRFDRARRRIAARPQGGRRRGRCGTISGRGLTS
jgi:hypothetical protein